MKRGFSLIEVLFAVVLVSTIGLALLQNASNTSSLIQWTLHKSDFMHRVSLVAVHIDASTQGTMSLENLIGKSYTLDDRTRKVLKDHHVVIDLSSEEKSSLEDSQKLQTQIDGKLDFLVKRYSLATEKYRTYLHVLALNP